MATVEQYQTSAGVRRYMVRYRTPDKTQTKKRGFLTKAAARDFASTVEVRKLEGSYIAPAAGKITFAVYAESWLEGKVNLAASTRARYRSALDVHLLPSFGSRPLVDLTREDVRDWITRSSKVSAPATVHKSHMILRQILDQALVDSRLAVNPAAGVDLPKVEHKDRRFLEIDQVHAFADAAGPHKVLVETLAFTGLRFGELAALQVQDVNLEAARIRVHRSVTEVDSQMVWSAPKSNRGRTVPLPGFLAAALAPIVRGQAPDALLFPDGVGGPLRVRNVRRGWWNRAVEDAGIPAGLSPHELRHTAASLAITAGANIKTLQRMLGHASAALTLDRYGHLYDDDLGMVADSLHNLSVKAGRAGQDEPGQP